MPVQDLAIKINTGKSQKVCSRSNCRQVVTNELPNEDANSVSAFMYLEFKGSPICTTCIKTLGLEGYNIIQDGVESLLYAHNVTLRNKELAAQRKKSEYQEPQKKRRTPFC